MRHLILHSSTFILCCMIAGCSAPATKEQTTTRSKEQLIKEGYTLDSLYLEAYNKGDAEALMAIHWNSPELLSYPPGKLEVKGYDAIKAMYAKDFADNKGAKLEYLSVVNVPLGEGVAGYGTYRWTLPVGADSSIVMEGRYSDIKEYRDGKMVIVFDHSSESSAQ